MSPSAPVGVSRETAGRARLGSLAPQSHQAARSPSHGSHAAPMGMSRLPRQLGLAKSIVIRGSRDEPAVAELIQSGRWDAVVSRETPEPEQGAAETTVSAPGCSGALGEGPYPASFEASASPDDGRSPIQGKLRWGRSWTPRSPLQPERLFGVAPAAEPTVARPGPGVRRQHELRPDLIVRRPGPSIRCRVGSSSVSIAWARTGRRDLALLSIAITKTRLSSPQSPRPGRPTPPRGLATSLGSVPGGRAEPRCGRAR